MAVVPKHSSSESTSEFDPEHSPEELEVPGGLDQESPKPRLVSGSGVDSSRNENFGVDIELKHSIQSARSVEELKSIIERAGVVQGGRAYKAEEVIVTIQNAQNFLDKHLFEIVTGVINQGNESFRDELGKHVTAITNGGPLGIREKVRELMKEQMKNAFERDRKGMVSGAVERARDFGQLYEVIKQFKRGVNVAGENEKSRITAEEAIERIDAVHGDLIVRMRDKRWLQRPLPELQQELKELVLGNIPRDSGIDRKVFLLLLELIKERRVDSEAQSVSGGFMKSLGRMGRGLLSRFRR